MESNMEADDIRHRSVGDADTLRDGEHQRPRLIHLKDATDLEVADGDPDIRGWDLRTRDGQKIGTVEDLVVDTSLMRVRFIAGEVMLDDVASDGARDGAHDGTREETRRVLIPIESAQLDDEDDNVIVSLTTADARALPAYDGGAIPDGNVDSHYAFDDSSFFGARRLGRESSSYIAPLSDRTTRHTEPLDSDQSDAERR